MKMVPYQIVQSLSGDAWVEANGQTYSPSKIAGFVLAKMKKIAEDYLGRPVSGAVISVPSYFNDAQRKATKVAGRFAGFDVLRIINETTAAALSYGLNNKEGCIAVFHLGGGTFNVSILHISKDVFVVKATNGDTSLGGEDFDNTLLEYLVSEFKRMESVDLSKDINALWRLRDAAEKAKIELSSTDETRINLPFITADAAGAKHLSITITRSKLEELVNDLVERTKNACTSCLKDAGLSAKDIDEVLLLGGMTQLPKIRKTVTEIFGKTPTEALNPDEVVAMGAAIQAGILRGDLNHLKVYDITPRSLSMETYGGIITRLIERHTTLAKEIAKSFSTAYDNQTEAVLRVCQSENEVPNDNMKRQDFILMGIPHGSRGVPMIIVTLKFDADGIMNVSAKNMQYGRGQVLSIISSESLCDSEQLLIREEELHVEYESQFKRQEGVLLPPPVDWDAQGFVSPVIDQLSFGTCWAIAAVASTESAYGIKRGHLIELSIQQLIDCADIDGFEGGHEYFAFRFMKLHGLCAAKYYPYTGYSQQGCDITKSQLPLVKIDGFQTVPLKALDIIHALTNQPLYAVFTEEFASHPDYEEYDGGLYGGGDKNKELPDDICFHSVCIIGWGYDHIEQHYFLKIKDSKGTEWGDEGEHRMDPSVPLGFCATSGQNCSAPSTN
ncbi:hypothetical protein C5167_008203 [Papaver somniferum]|uniref:Peptidase C1A papain C-terminal domain-containing protein n=1 Tax=Papaver somniferum TaxID=3469 RepID=A0A4Y7JXL9_PAPSO|nr:hypothetical protein C5167_008203 [Papaver somniferum]